MAAAQPLRWAVQVKTTTNRETTGLVEVGRIVGVGDAFWVQVRNSVYLAAGDLIWVIKDPSAQGNWIFDGFVKGAGTGESLNNSPIPSVQTPIVTSPDGTPLIIRPITGQQGTIGRINETINFPGSISIDQNITFGSLGAGIVQADGAGVLSSDYTIDATTTWATTTNIMPTDASGQDLGDATHRWDLHTQELRFEGAAENNFIIVPDNAADAFMLYDAGDLEYIRIHSTDAQPAFVFNDAGADVDFTFKASGVADAFQVQGSDGQITLGALGAGLIQATAGGVLSSDYIIDSTVTMASGQNIVPTDASGQDLGDATHRWDLYTQDVIFGGATGTNVITVPDNLADALHLSDAGGIEYMRVVSTDAQPGVVFNNGEADIDFRVAVAGGIADPTYGLGIDGATGAISMGAAPSATSHLFVYNPTLNTTVDYYGGRFTHTKIAGVTDHTDYMYGLTGHMRMNQAAGVIGHLYGGFFEAQMTLGDVGIVAANRHVYAIQAQANIDGGTINGWVQGMLGQVLMDGGTVTGSIIGLRGYVDLSAGTVTGDAYGIQIWMDDDLGIGGTSYMLYLSENTGIDYGIYQAGTAPHYLGGALGVGTVPGAKLDVDQSSGTGAIPVLVLDQGDVSEQHIVCTMSGADVDFPAIIQLTVTGTPTLGWDETADEWTLNKGLQITGDLILPKTAGKGIKVDTTTPTFGWRDLRAEIRTRGVGSSDPNDATYRVNIKAYTFSVGDEAWIEFHIPHDYVDGTDIHLHFHWSHNSGSVTGGSVTWGANVTYAKGHDQAAFPATVNPTLVANASTTQYRHLVSEVQLSASAPSATQIDTDDLEPDGIILARVYLSANNMTASNGVPDPFLHEVDVHYQSTNIATKDKEPDFYT